MHFLKKRLHYFFGTSKSIGECLIAQTAVERDRSNSVTLSSSPNDAELNGTVMERVRRTDQPVKNRNTETILCETFHCLLKEIGLPFATKRPNVLFVAMTKQNGSLSLIMNVSRIRKDAPQVFVC